MTNDELNAIQFERASSYWYALARHHTCFGMARPHGPLRDAQLKNASRYQRLAAVISADELRQRINRVELGWQSDDQS